MSKFVFLSDSCGVIITQVATLTGLARPETEMTFFKSKAANE
jgi:hypothetical protein